MFFCFCNLASMTSEMAGLRTTHINSILVCFYLAVQRSNPCYKILRIVLQKFHSLSLQLFRFILLSAHRQKIRVGPAFRYNVGLYTAKPLLSVHFLWSGQFSKSWNHCQSNTVNNNPINRAPLFRAAATFRSSQWRFSIVFTPLNDDPKLCFTNSDGR